MNNSTIHIITAAADNTPSDDKEGWANLFKNFIELVFLQMGEGTRVNIKVHSDDLDEGFKHNDAVIGILSNHLINNISKVQFLEKLITAKKQGDSDIQVFKVMKAPISQHDMPQELRQLLAYNFYYIDMESGVVKEYEQFENIEADNAFWLTIVDLVYDILNHFHGEQYTKATMGKGKTIYLAEVGSDLSRERQLVKRELKRFGYRILPDRNLPDKKDELEIMVKSDLEKCTFSIHMIGEERGALVEGRDETFTEIQERIADEHSTQSFNNHQFFNQLVWLSPNMKITNEKHRIFIEELKKNTNKEFGSELIQMRLEDFKSVILRQLAQQIKQTVNIEQYSTGLQGSGKPKIYLITDKRDFRASEPIAEWLKSQGYELLWPGDGSSTTDRATHVKFLNECDASIIYFQDASKDWLITKLQDILKSPGLGRSKPKGPNGVFTTSEQVKTDIEKLKEQYEQYEEFEIINQNGTVVFDELFSGFLKDIEQV